MERRTHTGRRAGLAAMIAGLALSVAIVPGGADAVPSPGYQSPDGSYCYDPNVDCGYAGLESGVYTESFDAYAYAPGLCRTRYARAVRRNLAGFVVFRYNEQVRWCWKGNVITYFWRDRWPSDTAFGWTFDGHHAETNAFVTVSGWEEWDLGEDLKIKISLGWFDAEDYARQIATGGQSSTS